MRDGGEQWHVLQFSDVLDLEFARALSEDGPVVLWKPDRSWLPVRPAFREVECSVSARLQVRSFAVMHGSTRFPEAMMQREGRALAERIARRTEAPDRAVLVCTTPYFAAVAESWPGPVVYWLTDRIAEYEGADPERVRAFDGRMCAAARLVCPNSERLATYLQEQAGCERGKMVVLPNATRAANVLEAPLLAPTELPKDVRRRLRPVVGVIGALGGNMDWVFVRELMELTPWLWWMFVGPAEMHIRDRRQRLARGAVKRDGRACFTGAAPYGELFTYARAVSAAVLPYCRREPTYSGSSTRFYEHLAACHPMIATRGVAELCDKEPLLRLVDSPEEAAEVLGNLRERGFDDGWRSARWQASRTSTWSERAREMRRALTARNRS